MFLEKIEAEEHPMSVTDERFRAKIEEAFSYRYPYQGEDQLKMKYTVSELKKICGDFGRRRWRNTDSGRGDCSNPSEFYERGRRGKRSNKRNSLS